MSLAIVRSRAAEGIEAPEVLVEVQLSPGLPSFNIVGLPEAEVKEARDRVRAAIHNSQFDFPLSRVTVNLAPADLPKEGGRFDLPIAIGILAASEQLPLRALEQHEFYAELSLGGNLRGVRGILPAVWRGLKAGRIPIVAQDNAAEAALVDCDARARSADQLLQVCSYLRGAVQLPKLPEPPQGVRPPGELDLRDVCGQHQARRALEVAAAGGHHMLFVGPPGSGKTMLASRLPGILPELDDQEALEVAAIASVSVFGVDASRWRERPYRSPHHTASGVALVGGGSVPRPGEISLAHRGVLFLDELTEWPRQVLDVLREPLESGRVVISRAARQAEFPSRFQLVAAMNPCPCGYADDPSGRCSCSPDVIARYRGRVSGPLLDRIDVQIYVGRVPIRELRAGSEGEPSEVVRARVLAARARQLARAGKVNAQLNGSEVSSHCALAEAEQRLLERVVEHHGLSARAYHRLLKVARTVADLSGRAAIAQADLAEAISLRQLDRARGGARQGFAQDPRGGQAIPERR